MAVVTRMTKPNDHAEPTKVERKNTTAVIEFVYKGQYTTAIHKIRYGNIQFIQSHRRTIHSHVTLKFTSYYVHVYQKMAACNSVLLTQIKNQESRQLYDKNNTLLTSQSVKVSN